MTGDLVHPTPPFCVEDIEVRRVDGAFGQVEELTLERFYWIHLDWYDEHGFLAESGGLGGLVEQLDRERDFEAIEDGLRILVDHWMIPKAIRSALPPFDQWDERARLEVTDNAEVFRK